MKLTEQLLGELDREAARTRRVLEQVPAGRDDWKPHDKSMSLGQLAGHLANLPSWCSATLDVTVLDLDTIEDARPKAPASRAALLEEFDKKVAAARTKLTEATDPAFMAPWTLKKGDQVFFTMPRISAIRGFVMNHSIHHRGQLSVYLRLNDVPVPPMYGPTADEQF